MATVLVVDNSQEVVSLTSLLLQVYGHDVVGATTGEEALTIARTMKCDVAVLDIAMPGMCGLELLQELQDLWGNGPTYIALTGWGTQQMRRMALEAGFDFYCTKPMDARKLHGLIDHAVRKTG